MFPCSMGWVNSDANYQDEKFETSLGSLVNRSRGQVRAILEEVKSTIAVRIRDRVMVCIEVYRISPDRTSGAWKERPCLALSSSNWKWRPLLQS